MVVTYEAISNRDYYLLVNDRESDADSVEQAQAGGWPQSVGQFRFFIDNEKWEWSDEVQRMHGYHAGELPSPTTEQVLSHKHPDDYSYVVGALEVTRREGVPFSTRHRMIDTAGKEHLVVLVAEQMHDSNGTVTGSQGFYVDITPVVTEQKARVTAAVEQFTASRPVIEHAKGMLMLVYGVDEEAAFGLLRWRSQVCNVKLRDLAKQLVAEFRRCSGEIPERGAFDSILMTVHNRIGSDPV